MVQLDRLNRQLYELRLLAEQIDQKGERHAYARLSVLDERFSCRSDNYLDYVEELTQDLQRLVKLSELSQDIDLLALYRDRFVGKFAMLRKQLNSANYRSHQQQSNQQQQQRVKQWKRQLNQTLQNDDLSALQRRLEQQRHFETQLNQQIAAKNQQRSNSVNPKETARLGAELLALQARLGECQKATWKIEHKMELIRNRFKE